MKSINGLKELKKVNKKTSLVWELDEKFKVISVEVDYDSVGIIEKLIKQQPELGYSSVEGYLEGLFHIKENEISKELKSEKE